MHDLDTFLASHDAGDLLDMACGAGRFTRHLVTTCRSVRAVVGLDIKQGVRADFLGAVDGVDATFVATPIADYLAGAAADAFDTVSVANALHHIEDVGAVLGRLRPVLRDRGVVIVQEMHADDLTPAQETQRQLHAFMAELHTAAGEHHRAVFTGAEIDAMLDAAGLQVVHRFHLANDGPVEPGAGSSPMPGRIDEAIARAWPDGAPAEVTQRRAALQARVDETGVGAPPSLTLVCRLA